METIQLYPAVARWIDERRGEFEQIPEARKSELEEVAAYVRTQLDKTGTARLTFICTHNSRRSHLSQIWAKVAADTHGLTGVTTYSGGTEATAMNPRVVDSLRRSGIAVDADNQEADNPRYRVRYSEDCKPLECFSKVFSDSPNPRSDYAAVMTCSSADQACPVVSGCDLRSPIRYEDPKVADGTPQEATVYDERSRQICREMLYMVSKV
ncbi:low molecular weight phosphatase family protein [Stieleria mannarensis]|uniref:arsenate-mycothiol transferase ArsC n=1 Tax=Stieleria mannarensis TaxID=2755585 RepID=UPI0016047FAA|nr:protein-tyrosine-phosphatase [Rhodopirellula sp. JC639]